MVLNGDRLHHVQPLEAVLAFSRAQQVWSLTQFYSVNSSLSRTSEQSVILQTHLHIHNRGQLFWTEPCKLVRTEWEWGTPDIVIVPLKFWKKRMRRGCRPLRGPVQTQKALQSETKRLGSCWEELRRAIFSQRGVIDLPSSDKKFFNKRKRKKYLVIRPGTWVGSRVNHLATRSHLSLHC